MRFQDKVVVITGGDKGIGRAIAVGFAREGAKIVNGYYQDAQASQETVNLIRQAGGTVEPLQMDVRRKADCHKLVATAVEQFGRLDIAVNNAGVSSMNRAVDLTEEDWDFNMDVNAKGVFFCCQAQVAQFIRQGDGGNIVNIASLASKRPAPLLAHYAASKFAVLGFSKSLAMEVAEHDIRVNCVCPGLVRTAMQEREIGWEAALRGMTPDQVRQEYIATTPLRRLEEPEDVARVAFFLASEDAVFMTGQAVNVTGGIEMTA
ncbi:glucose 1-dehydrogenase [candidate division KSB3 bacterium]|uniref:Glucose 1-dehydrogenase n=1 Tax=candidate division KSB3 bacterium TaxID=2044937 RepID=A0A9D5Q4Y7_9BACT|nr:glucose 1-dehydrogenase [candidate division KSB3 bacterium]MBD3323773.1 glucose 1-dehydrogenase [candidate division KSB3 bacterium]